MTEHSFPSYDPSQFGPDPSQFGPDPSTFGPDPSQFTPDSQAGPDPDMSGQGLYGFESKPLAPDPDRYEADPGPEPPEPDPDSVLPGSGSDPWDTRSDSLASLETMAAQAPDPPSQDWVEVYAQAPDPPESVASTITAADASRGDDSSIASAMDAVYAAAPEPPALGHSAAGVSLASTLVSPAPSAPGDLPTGQGLYDLPKIPEPFPQGPTGNQVPAEPMGPPAPPQSPTVTAPALEPAPAPEPAPAAEPAPAPELAVEPVAEGAEAEEFTSLIDVAVAATGVAEVAVGLGGGLVGAGLGLAVGYAMEHSDDLQQGPDPDAVSLPGGAPPPEVAGDGGAPAPAGTATGEAAAAPGDGTGSADLPAADDNPPAADPEHHLPADAPGAGHPAAAIDPDRTDPALLPSQQQIDGELEKIVAANHDHHIFPQQFRDEFSRLGISIDQKTVTIPAEDHIGRGGLHSTGDWNGQWQDFFDRIPHDLFDRERAPDDPSIRYWAAQAIELAIDMLNEAGLAHLDPHPWGQR